MKKIFYGTIEKGRIVLTDQSLFTQAKASLEGKEIQLTLTLKKKDRSLNQNRYYHGVVVKTLSDFTGYEREEMHDSLRMLFLRDESKVIPTLRSTTDLTTVEMEEYLAEIRRWAAKDLNCFVPEPNEIEI